MLAWNKNHLFVLFLVAVTSFEALANWQPLPLRERAQVIDNITEQRIKALLPSLMTEHGVDMWLIISRKPFRTCPSIFRLIIKKIPQWINPS